MKTRSILNLFFACSLLVLATACDVKDPIFNTAHPGHGTVTLTTDWSTIGTGLTAPESYTVTPPATAGYTATLTGVTNRLDHLFEPGTYQFCVYNAPEGITVKGSVATVAQAAVTPTDAVTPADAAPADNPGTMISNAPGWLFTSVMDNIGISQDAEYTLTGAASTLDFATDIHADPQAVALSFTKITTGAHAGSWLATVRLLGVTGPAQLLKTHVFFAGGNPPSYTVSSDLTPELTAFNKDKRTPLVLDGSVDTPPEADFGATITDWETVTGDGPVVAD